MELASLLPIVAIGLVFWLLLIRPQSRRQKQQREMQASLTVGDRVLLTSGILGTLVAIGEADRLHVEVADGVVFEVVRPAVARVLEPTTGAAGPGPGSPEPLGPADGAEDGVAENGDPEDRETRGPGEREA